MPSSLSNSAAEAAKEREFQRPRRKNSPTVRPLPQTNASNDRGTRYSIAQRAQVVSLHTIGLKSEDIASLLRIPARTIYKIVKKVKERGFNPQEDPRLLDHYVEDGYKSGRPKEIKETAEIEVLDDIRRGRADREKSTDVLAYEHGKARLNTAQRKARLEFCLSHQDWTLDDWKKAIWSDETSVVLCRRGSQRIWRDKDEAFKKSAIRNRWKGFSSFMFWGCFSYNEKGPFHIWTKETATEKEAAQKEIDEFNRLREPALREEWELEIGINRPELRTRPRRKPQWRFKEIVLTKMVPFARQLGPKAIVQVDNAAPHAQHFIGSVYSLASVKHLLWPGNSPDLNAIEKAWPWIKKRTTFHGPAQSIKELEKRWKLACNNLPQSQIQIWIEGIVNNIKKVIELEGGNEYPEGRETKRSYKGRRKVGEIYKHCWINDNSIDVELRDNMGQRFQRGNECSAR
ncbi:uncharacterized protein Z518_00116 [Rhinocladiella mackenziei CBS 650.93]|uniref:Tc1-like transposase DDE domain-containing protein n=1 Tax=Rhinocladiella mackenziei CBS 650.93 TaxID=1442369 RepID=A0A0D2HEL9_9EURO|nr:uncharacterized protein Z518_00116 [Rhinocladiella mackenziei CBS 650.93]KIX09038.1 hypothetical protein Z518_00116 [Rhinocladiella mackenziei CBS 650.93]